MCDYKDIAKYFPILIPSCTFDHGKSITCRINAILCGDVLIVLPIDVFPSTKEDANEC